MKEIEQDVAGLRTLLVGDVAKARQIVVMLHGYTMQPEDLSPFTQSLRVAHTAYALPQAHLTVAHGGHTWWAIDEPARQRQLARGPRDLAEARPSGLPDARQQVERFLSELITMAPHARLVLGGFSQGGMLACDLALHTTHPVSALFMLSASLLDHTQWQPRLPRLQGLPTLVSHGRADENLAFSAGERLRDALTSNGAQVQWVPFDGGHQIPLTVWRQLRRFLQARAGDHSTEQPPP